MINDPLNAVQAVIEKLGGVLGINEYLQKIEAASRYERRTESASYYELVTRVIRRQFIGYCEANYSRFAQWQKGEGVFGYEVMIVGDADRIILPSGRLGFLFKPQEGDHFQIRSTAKSEIIGLIIYYYSLRDRIDRLILEKKEAKEIANRPFEKQTYNVPIAFFGGSLGNQSVRDWAEERRRAEYEYEMGEKARRLAVEIPQMQKVLEEFVTIRELLEPTPQLKKILAEM